MSGLLLIGAINLITAFAALGADRQIGAHLARFGGNPRRTR